MQKRHLDRELYFKEQTATSREFYLDFVKSSKPLGPATRVIEVGCGDGGNLLPFAEAGCEVMGVDINGGSIANARRFFEAAGLKGTFVADDFTRVPCPQDEPQRFDIVLLHDVIEHIEPDQKDRFLRHLMQFMRQDAVAFVAFPAWQMPFGGHQQICQGKLSKIPFLHLLPTGVYRRLLVKAGEPDAKVQDLLSIKRSKMPVEKFTRLARTCGLHPVRRVLWLINPHYRQKFGLRPVREVFPFDRLPYLRNFYTTSAWFLLVK